MKELLENNRDPEEVYLKFALSCFEGVKGIPLDEFFEMENGLYENFLDSLDPRGARSA